jgi:hypothetical protein
MRRCGDLQLGGLSPMSVLDAAPAVATVADALSALLAQVRAVLNALAPFRPVAAPTVDYENLRLDIVLDIADTRGRRAVLARRQLVRMLVPVTGVVRDLIWGNGNQVVRYSSRSASRLALRPEGPKQVLLLGLPHRPVKDERVLLQSRRTIHDALQEPSEYCEMLVERPTRRLGMKILFPRSRPPTAARLVTEQGTSMQRVPVRYGADGRPFLQWGCMAPKQDWTYSLRWSW